MSAFAYLLIWSCPAYFYGRIYIYHQIKDRLLYQWETLKNGLTLENIFITVTYFSPRKNILNEITDLLVIHRHSVRDCH